MSNPWRKRSLAVVEMGTVRGTVMKAVGPTDIRFYLCPACGNPIEIRDTDTDLAPFVGRQVYVTGHLTYSREQPNPLYLETISTIIELPADEDLPKLSELRGILTGCLDGPSEQILRELREDE